jgi:hypothetical protein
MQVIAFFRKRKECKRKGKIKEKEEEGKSGRQWGRERSVGFHAVDLFQLFKFSLFLVFFLFFFFFFFFVYIVMYFNITSG